MPGDRRWQGWPFLLLVVVSVLVSAWMILASTNRDLTTLELTLFQVLALGIGLTSSFAFGRQSAAASAQEMVRPHARSAFRRLVFMFDGLGRIAAAVEQRREGFELIAAENDGDIPKTQALAALEMVEALVVSQIGTASDAMEDWRDLVPDEVEEIENRAREVARA